MFKSCEGVSDSEQMTFGATPLHNDSKQKFGRRRNSIISRKIINITDIDDLK